MPGAESASVTVLELRRNGTPHEAYVQAVPEACELPGSWNVLGNGKRSMETNTGASGRCSSGCGTRRRRSSSGA